MISAAGVATMVFYNQVLGVDPWLCGVVFFVASVVDAVSDPLVGSWSDNFRSRWGRRHPFMLLSVTPLALAFYLMYAPPADLSELQYFWWFLGTMVMLRLGKTFYTIPYDALGAELTDDYHERTSVFGYNGVISMVAGAVLGVLVLASERESERDETLTLQRLGHSSGTHAPANLQGLWRMSANYSAAASDFCAATTLPMPSHSCHMLHIAYLERCQGSLPLS